MKKQMLRMMTVAIMALTFTSCSTETVSGGEEGVFIKQPYIFGSGGVDTSDLLTDGRGVKAWTTEFEKFTVTPINYEEKFENMASNDNTPLDFETHLTLQIIPGRSPHLLKYFGKGWYVNSVAQVYRGMVRKHVSRYAANGLISNDSIVTKIDNTIETELQTKFNEMKLPVRVTAVNIGKAVPPDDVLKESERTSAQKQAILTQNARKENEDSRKAAEISKAIADKAYMNEMHFSTQEYLQSQKLLNEQKMIEVIDKKGANISVFMGSNPTPVINTK
jgi:regulator of protease activity HflC (stomatin/prohibitin superfamily)